MIQVLDRDPLVNLPSACTDGPGKYRGWAYYVPYTATTVSGLEFPLYDDYHGWSVVDALDQVNDLVNRNGQTENRVGALVMARYCENDHRGQGRRIEIDQMAIVADERGKKPLGPVRVSYNYQTATSFEPRAEPDDARPLFLPFKQDASFPESTVAVSYGTRRFLVAVPGGAILVSKGFLLRD